MNWIGIIFTAVLLQAAFAVAAQAPFEFGGLHTDLMFSDAVEKVLQLGGACKVTQSKSSTGGVAASCQLLPCTVGTDVGVCQEKHPVPTKLSIGSQPIVSIELDAQSESTSLRRITFRYDGDFDAVEKNLIAQFGPPTSDVATSEQQSWNHARPQRWKNGDHTMVLVNTPKLLVLSRDKPAADAGER